MPLTGRFTLRRSMMGKIVLQVEEEVKAVWPFSRRAPTRRRWRDAHLMDLAAPEMRALIDLRLKPRLDVHRYHYAPAEALRLADEEAATAPPSEAPLADGRARTTTH
jgi:hypothetical protein